jgi:hypothetical protein
VGNNGINKLDKRGLASWNWEWSYSSTYSISYDQAMTQRTYGPPSSYRKGTEFAAAYAASLGGQNNILFQHYLNGGGAVDLTSDATIQNEVENTLAPKMDAAENDIVKQVESFKGPCGFPVSTLGDKDFTAIDRAQFRSSIWVIGRSNAGLSKKCNAIVFCGCNGGQIMAVTLCDFHMYFYDQFADAADKDHTTPEAQEWVGGTQFDETGAWGRTYGQIGYYK